MGADIRKAIADFRHSAQIAKANPDLVERIPLRGPVNKQRLDGPRGRYPSNNFL
jgi:hypothetical protein